MKTKQNLLVLAMIASAVLAACNEMEMQPEEPPPAELRTYVLGDAPPLELGGAILVVADDRYSSAQVTDFIEGKLEGFAACQIPDVSIVEFLELGYLRSDGMECNGPPALCGGFPQPRGNVHLYMGVCERSHSRPRPPNQPGQPDAGSDAEPDAAPDAGSVAAPDAGSVVAPDASPDLPPQVFITSPAAANVSLIYDGYDAERGLWYADIALAGRGTDPEDGALPDSSLVWKTDRSDLQDELLDTGQSTTVRLYSNDCFGVTHQIRLEASDSDGNQAEPVTRTIHISTLC